VDEADDLEVDLEKLFDGLGNAEVGGQFAVLFFRWQNDDYLGKDRSGDHEGRAHSRRRRAVRLDHISMNPNDDTERANQISKSVDSSNRNAVTVPWIRALLGDEAVERIMIPLATDREERRRIRQVFPESKLTWFRRPWRYWRTYLALPR